MINTQDQQFYSANEIESHINKKADTKKSYYIDGEIKQEEKLNQNTVAVEYSKETQESDKLKLDIKEKEELLSMRKEWAVIFKKIVITILAFEIILTFSVGSGLMEFQDEWFLRIIISGGFAQILIMPFTLTKFLFNTDSKLSKE